jgi:hypothetical protein
LPEHDDDDDDDDDGMTERMVVQETLAGLVYPNLHDGRSLVAETVMVRDESRWMQAMLHPD